MYDAIAFVMEIFSIVVISNHFYVNRIRLSSYLAILAFSTLYGIINQYFTDISPVQHYLIFTVLVLCIHREEPKWVALFATLVGYALLIYLQVICLRWFHAEWLAQNYELAGLVINVIVLAVVIGLHFLIQYRRVDVQYHHLKWWQIAMTTCVAVGVILFCFVYKPILEEQYYIDTYVWLCLVGIVLIAALLIGDWSRSVRDKQTIRDLQNKIEKEYSYRHDYDKEIRILSGTGRQMAGDILKGNEKRLCFERLPEYPQKVIEEYLIEFEEKKIEIRWDIPEPILQWKPSLKDTISIIGNLVENAIEAVEALPEEERWIQISFKKVQESGALQICICNPFEKGKSLDKAVTEKGVSSKGQNRGYGLYIVMQRTKRYRGEIRTFTKDQVFAVVIDIPNS